MPRPRPLPDLTGVDLAELQLAVLSIFERNHMDPEFRRTMGDTAGFGAMCDQCGGAQRVLAEALAAIRHRRTP